jgi:hypothetical protein
MCGFQQNHSSSGEDSVKKLALLGLTLALLVGGVDLAVAKGAGGTGESSSYEVLSTEEAQYLLFLREEEKLAHDVYTTLYKQWRLNIFSNIAESEQRHMDAVKALLDKYGLGDPLLAQTGQFTNQDLQAAYDALVERGFRSLMDALQVGGFIEELDIKDLQAALTTTSREDITQVYEDLMRGSRNHLRAFAGQIENRGIDYEAQILPQSEVDEIIDSPTESGK